METGAGSFFHTDMERVFTHGGMLVVRIIRIKDKKLWGIRSGGQHTTRVSIVKGNVRCKWIRGKLVYFGGRGISSMVMGGISRYGLTQSTGKVLLKES